MFGETLRSLRERAGLTQQQVCEKTGLTMDGLSKLERGLRQPGWETVQKLADAIGATCQEFRDGAGSTSPPSPPKLGRPKKADSPPATAEPKKQRGRPRKSDGK